jgi:L-fuculokinase
MNVAANRAVIAIFDIGKTNKKVFLFDDDYQIVWEKSTRFSEIYDEDGDPCEDIETLTTWILSVFDEILNLPNFNLKAVNFSAYGASFVPLDQRRKPLTPLYNYLKPYPENLKKQFYDSYGSEDTFATTTASPVLGSLNSGMQIYRLKNEKPGVFSQVKYYLHLPQYLSFLFTGQFQTDITSIGCHTNLWNFTTNKYHQWVLDEQIEEKLPPIRSQNQPISLENGICVGIGLHDSSSAIVPYFINFSEPFVLVSTGTWNISLNPFNDTALTYAELQSDCLCYLNYTQKPIKAARLFAGNEHEIQTKKLADYFDVPLESYRNVAFDESIVKSLRTEKSHFINRAFSSYKSYEEAYHRLIIDIVAQQIISTDLVIHNSPVKKIFVDGGFSKNSIFMTLLAEAFPEIEVYAANVAQASALGAAVAIHGHWNQKPLPENLISLKRY